MYLCERCGWAHVCGDACVEDATGGASELRVCPISGRCFEKLVVEWGEVRAAPLAVASKTSMLMLHVLANSTCLLHSSRAGAGLSWRGMRAGR